MLFIGLIGLALATSFAAGPTRTLKPEDFAALRDVDEPNLSPDGNFIAYVAKSADAQKDKKTGNLWLAKWDGSENRALTFGNKGQSHPRWSPDGKCGRPIQNALSSSCTMPTRRVIPVNFMGSPKPATSSIASSATSIGMRSGWAPKDRRQLQHPSRGFRDETKVPPDGRFILCLVSPLSISYANSVGPPGAVPTGQSEIAQCRLPDHQLTVDDFPVKEAAKGDPVFYVKTFIGPHYHFYMRPYNGFVHAYTRRARRTLPGRKWRREILCMRRSSRHP